MAQPEVLFSLKAADGSARLLELKRPELKGAEDFGRYCSWFHVDLVAGAAATRLSFQSWDKEAGVRVFAEGRLEGPGEGTWTWRSMEGGGAVGLREEGDDGAGVIGACIAAWGD